MIRPRKVSRPQLSPIYSCFVQSVSGTPSPSAGSRELLLTSRVNRAGIPSRVADAYGMRRRPPCDAQPTPGRPTSPWSPSAVARVPLLTIPMLGRTSARDHARLKIVRFLVTHVVGSSQPTIPVLFGPRSKLSPLGRVAKSSAGNHTADVIKGGFHPRNSAPSLPCTRLVR